jgi:hypothetical protein
MRPTPPASYAGRHARPGAPGRRSRRRRFRRQIWLGALGVGFLLVGAAMVGGLLPDPSRRVAATPPWSPPLTEPVTLPTSAPAAPLAAPAPSRPARQAAPVLRVAGAFPEEGAGTFTFDERTGPVHGTAGSLRRFRVGVENGVPETVASFAAAVDQALGDPRSWPAGRQVRLQRVGRDAAYEFTIYLASARTAGRMCAAGGINIQVGGQPYTSCRVGGQVIINLARWRLSAPDYVANRVPLAAYRMYVINHEVGHQLGHNHERCPGQGRPAPVMLKQTLGLDGCVAYPWPYRGGRRYAGPAE